MSVLVAKKEQFSQLEEVLAIPIVALELSNFALTMRNARHQLNTTDQCCIIAAASKGNQKLEKVRTLRNSLVMLKRLQQQIRIEYPLANANLIGIYPSLEYPICVYELNTNADRYVASNVLPSDRFALIRIIKYIIGKFIGTNPNVGGLGLIIHKD
jgi:hypothetical protein